MCILATQTHRCIPLNALLESFPSNRAGPGVCGPGGRGIPLDRGGPGGRGIPLDRAGTGGGRGWFQVKEVAQPVLPELSQQSCGQPRCLVLHSMCGH